MASANNTRISLARLATFLAKCKDTFALKSALNNKQDKLKWDSTPTLNSANPVTSDGIMKALNKKQNSGNYQTKLTFDTKPTANSSNPVTSGGVLSAINNAMASSGAQFYKKPKEWVVLAGSDADPKQYVKPDTSKNINLSQPYTDFDALLFIPIFTENGSPYGTYSSIWPTWFITYISSVTNVFIDLMYGNDRWYSINTTDDTKTFKKYDSRNIQLMAIIGLKW